MLIIEDLLPYFGISGEAHLRESPSRDHLAARPPVNIIQDDQTLYVHFKWNQKGLLGWMFCDSFWKLQVFLELMGTGETPSDHPVQHIPFVQGQDVDYHEIVSINNLKEGVYKVVVSMTLCSRRGKVTPLAAHQELGLVQVYEDFG